MRDHRGRPGGRPLRMEVRMSKLPSPEEPGGRTVTCPECGHVFEAWRG